MKFTMLKSLTEVKNQGGRFLKKLETELPYDPAIPLLGIHTEEPEGKETHVPQYSSQHCL